MFNNAYIFTTFIYMSLIVLLCGDFEGTHTFFSRMLENLITIYKNYRAIEKGKSLIIFE